MSFMKTKTKFYFFQFAYTGKQNGMASANVPEENLMILWTSNDCKLPSFALHYDFFTDLTSSWYSGLLRITLLC